jgi:hypothetical protein
MTDPASPEESEAELVARGVDRRDWEATEDDEEDVLRELYGPPDDDGIYRGVRSQ